MRSIVFLFFGILLAYTAVCIGGYAQLHAPAPVIALLGGIILIVIGSTGYLSRARADINVSQAEWALLIVFGSALVYGAITVPVGGTWYAPWTWPEDIWTGMFMGYGLVFLFWEYCQQVRRAVEKTMKWKTHLGRLFDSEKH